MSLALANFGQPSGSLVYTDDVIECSATWKAHLRLLEDMFGTLQTAGLTLKPSKIHFRPKKVQYLGHVLSADGIRMGEDRIKAISELKTSTTIKELRSVLGTINFVRKFIPNLASLIELLVALTRKSVTNLQTLRNHWGPEQDADFIKVKELLSFAPVLHFPQSHKSFTIYIDASDCGVGAFLTQKEDNEELAIIAYFSKRLTSSQQHYLATPKECLAVVLAVTHWRPYIWRHHFVCVTDQSALRYLYSVQDTSNNMLTRWAIALQSYDFTVEHNHVCVCVFSSHPFWTSSSLDVPAGVTQEEGHTGFLIHLPSAVRALIFVARRIQPFLSLVDREVEFCVLTN